MSRTTWESSTAGATGRKECAGTTRNAGPTTTTMPSSGGSSIAARNDGAQCRLTWSRRIGSRPIGGESNRQFHLGSEDDRLANAASEQYVFRELPCRLSRAFRVYVPSRTRLPPRRTTCDDGTRCIPEQGMPLQRRLCRSEVKGDAKGQVVEGPLCATIAMEFDQVTDLDVPTASSYYGKNALAKLALARQFVHPRQVVPAGLRGSDRERERGDPGRSSQWQRPCRSSRRGLHTTGPSSGLRRISTASRKPKP